MTLEAIVLAGGRGTRLAGLLGELPKPMADIAGRPFLAWLLDYLATFGVARVILATGYRHEVIAAYFGGEFAGMALDFSREEQPLGTGGALRQALGRIAGEHALVLNGDTFFAVDVREMMRFHLDHAAAVTLGVKALHGCHRYGTVRLEGDRVIGFGEKSFRGAGRINAGVYCVSKSLLREMTAAAFSFESDFLGKKLTAMDVRAYASDGYFIDIGVPEDYLRAQRELIGQIPW